jgi:hypothetical protein
VASGWHERQATPERDAPVFTTKLEFRPGESLPHGRPPAGALSDGKADATPPPIAMRGFLHCGPLLRLAVRAQRIFDG